MLTYSVAIRALPHSHYLKQEVESLFDQSIKPQKVFIILPQGSSPPLFRVANEEYIYVKKGMMYQRLLSYDEISSDCILMLDDDVKLQPDSVEKLLKAMEDNDSDLVGADTFQNHKLPLLEKIRAALTNLVFPHFSQRWAFKIHSNGSFSYIINPRKNYYPSQSCGGNAMLWKKASYNYLYMRDELWLEDINYTYSEDMLQSYKVYKNGMKLGVVFNSGITHLDYQSASVHYHKSHDKIKTRTMAQMAVWWRTCYKPGNETRISRLAAAFAFSLKMLWLFFMFLALSVVRFKFSYISNFLNGVLEGWKFVHSESFKNLPPYVVQ